MPLPTSSSQRFLGRRLLGLSVLTLLLLSFPIQLDFLPPNAVIQQLALETGRRGGIAASFAAVFGTSATVTAEESQARKPWEPKKAPIYVTFVFDLDPAYSPGYGSPVQNIKKVTVRLDPDWAPKGVKHFKELVETGDIGGASVFNVISGKHATKVSAPAEPLPIKWGEIVPRSKNMRAKMAFMPEFGNKLIFEMQDSNLLDRHGIQPIGDVIGDGMKVIDQMYTGYVFEDRLTNELSFQSLTQACDLPTGDMDRESPKLARIKTVTLSEIPRGV